MTGRSAFRLAIQVDIGIAPLLQGEEDRLHAAAKRRQAVFHFRRHLAETFRSIDRSSSSSRSWFVSMRGVTFCSCRRRQRPVPRRRRTHRRTEAEDAVQCRGRSPASHGYRCLGNALRPARHSQTGTRRRQRHRHYRRSGWRGVDRNPARTRSD